MFLIRYIFTKIFCFVKKNIIIIVFFTIAIIDCLWFEKKIIHFIEDNPVTLALLGTFITSYFCFGNFIKQKRAEAFFGFYTQLLLHIKKMRTWLEEQNFLEIDDFQKGNIYAIIFNKNTLNHEFPGFVNKINPNVLDEIKEIISPLEKIIIESNNNVYPKSAEKKKKIWYDSQAVLLSFCELIKHQSVHYQINELKNKSGEYRHIAKCKEFIQAMNEIQDLIEKEGY